MLPEVHDVAAHPMSESEVAELYRDCLALGDGTIRQPDLQQLLFVFVEKQTAQRMQHRSLEVSSDLQRNKSGKDLAELVRVWDSVRMSTDQSEPDEERLEWFLTHTITIKRIQRMWLAQLARVREHAASGRPPVLLQRGSTTAGELLGMG